MVGLAATQLHGGVEQVVAQTTEVPWQEAVDGEWSDSTKWGGGNVPGAAGNESTSALIGVRSDTGLYEVLIDEDLNLVGIRIDAREARILHSEGTVTAQVITAAGNNYILQGGTIRDATLSSVGNSIDPGRFVVFGETPSELINAPLDGTLNVGGTAATAGSKSAANLNITGDLKFLKSQDGLRFQGGGGTVMLPGDQTISSDATAGSRVTFGQDGDSSARIHSQGGLLTIESNVTVRTLSTGQSFLGKAGERLLNRGTVDVFRALETLTIEGDWRNEGKLQVSDGGLRLGGEFTTEDLGRFQSDGGMEITGTLDNRNATLDLTRRSDLGGTLVINGGTIVGGLVRSPGGDATLISRNATGTTGTLDGVTLAGEIQITMGTTRLLNGLSLSENARLNVNSPDASVQTVIQVDGTQSIDGVGEIVFNSGSTAVNVAAGQTLSLGSEVTVMDAGGIARLGSRGADLINHGMVVSNGAGTPLTLAGEFVDNRGVIQTANGSIVNIDAAAFASTGSIVGNGAITGAQLVSEGTVAPGASAGVLMVDSLRQTSIGILELEIGGLLAGIEHDQLIVTNSLELAGRVDLRLIDGFSPSEGDRFDLLDFGSGTFDALVFDFNGASLDAGLQWDVSAFEADGSISVTAVAVPEPSTVALWIGLIAAWGVRSCRRNA
ncbi:MAG: hypothetical protein AAF989_07095 [Planctomycetota bacterium]